MLLVFGLEREVDRSVEYVHGVVSAVAVCDIWVVFEQLCKHRAFIQNDFSLEMLATSKDKPYHIEAIARDQHVRRYVTWAQRFASMADERCRWGAQCSCHEAACRAGTSVVCGKLSRRLHEAPGANAVFLARVESHERFLDVGEVEGDQALLLRALTIVQCFRSDATAKTKWLSKVPKIFSLASRPETGQRHCGRPKQSKRTRTILSPVNSSKGLRPAS